MGEQANPNWERLQEIEALTARLIASQRTTQLAKIDEILIRLGEAQKHSDARLDALIAVVDDLVRENGGRGNSPIQ